MNQHHHRQQQQQHLKYSTVCFTILITVAFWLIRLTTVPTRHGDRIRAQHGDDGNDDDDDSGSRSSPPPSPSSTDSPTRDPLRGPPCNSVITTVSKEEIQSVATAWVDVIAPAEEFSEADRLAALQVYLGRDVGAPRYDLLVSKVCGSCADHRDRFMSRRQQPEQRSDHPNNDDDHWQSYCGPDVYGYEAPHSALVFHPLTDTDDDTPTPLPGVRTAGMGFQGTRLEVQQAFSTDFPVDVSRRLEETLGILHDKDSLYALSTSFVDAFPLMAAASLGMITVGPDGLGAGESATLYNRTYLTALPVRQTAVVNYYNAAAYTEKLTDGCTRLSPDAILTWGYSAGGAAVLFGTEALHARGLRVARTFTQAGVYHNPSLIQAAAGPFLRDPLHATISFDMAGFWALAAAAYSNDAPYLANTGTGQTLLSQAFTNPADPAHDILEWIFDEQISALELKSRVPRVGHDFLATVNPALFTPIGTSARAKGATFCDPPFLTSETGALCAALLENSPVSILEKLNDMPIEWCHSPNDMTVPFFSTRVYLLAADKPNVVSYEASLPFMQPFGNHGMGQILCAAAVPTFLTAHLDLLQSEEKDPQGDPLCDTHSSSTSSPSDANSKPPPQSDESNAVENFGSSFWILSVVTMVIMLLAI